MGPFQAASRLAQELGINGGSKNSNINISSILFPRIFGYASRAIPKFSETKFPENFHLILFPGIFWLNGADYAIKQLPKFSGNFPNKFLFNN